MSNFNNIFSNLNSEEVEELEKMRKNTLAIIVGIYITYTIIVILFFMFNFSNQVNAPKRIDFEIVLYGLIIISAIAGKVYLNYSKAYGKGVISKLVLGIDRNLKYNDSNSILTLQNLYRDSEFYRSSNSIAVDDCITGRPSIYNEEYNLMIAEITTRNQNSKNKEVTFSGMFSYIVTKNSYQGKISIKKKKFGDIYFEKRVLLDSPEFESKFNVYSEDEIRSRQLLTSETMQLILEYSEKFKYYFDISIVNNEVKLRISTGKMFEPNLVKHVLDTKSLKLFYDIIEFSYKLPISLDNSLKNTN